MSCTEKFKTKIRSLRDGYYEIGGLWEECSAGGDRYLCAEFISGCLDFISEVENLLSKEYTSGKIESDDVLNYLYNLKKIKSDYSELKASLDEAEIEHDYGRIEYVRGAFEGEDIATSMERLLNALCELD